MSPDPDHTLKEEAARWLARRDRGLTASEQDEFFDWLAQDPRHAEFLAEQQKTVAGLKLLAQWRPEHGARPNPDLLASHRPPRANPFLRQWLPLGLAAAAALAALLWWPDFRAEAEFVESPMIVRKVLEDGSSIDLNHGAEVAVDYTAERRGVKLLRGEATFTVAKNPTRPFVVHANGVDVRAVGTAFNVDLRAGEVHVLVTEGRVQVSPPAASATEPAPAPQLVTAGERTMVSLAEARVAPVSAVSPDEMARVLSWQPKQLEFDDTPLGQVVAVFNQSNRVKLVIDDPNLAALPIGASLRSDNVEGFVRVLESGFRIRAERRSDNVIVLRPGN